VDSTYARAYRRLYLRHWWWRARQHVILDALREMQLGERPWILDVGCGDGLFFDQLSDFGEVEGVEIDAARVAQSRWRSRIHVCPFGEAFRPGRQYAVVLMLDVLEHLDDPEAALRHALDLLAPDGSLLITVPAFRVLWTTHDRLNHHHTRYTQRSLRGLITDAGGDVRRMRYLFHWLFPAKLAVRLKEAMVPTEPASPKLPSGPINTALYGITRCEQALLRRVPVPFGGSLLAIARPVS
jgi:SAM-dependent methyltransferase